MNSTSQGFENKMKLCFPLTFVDFCQWTHRTPSTFHKRQRRERCPGPVIPVKGNLTATTCNNILDNIVPPTLWQHFIVSTWCPQAQNLICARICVSHQLRRVKTENNNSYTGELKINKDC